MEQYSLRLYWMTDIHLVDELTGRPDAAGAIWMERHYYAALDKLRQAVDIVNRERPDYVICTGDVIDREQSLDSFMKEWERIEPPKAFVPGNHDLSIGGEAFEEQFGIAGQPLTAGSRFNRSIAMRKGETEVRVLLLDNYIGEDGNRLYDTCEGTITEEAFEWLENEILFCPESLILLFSHNGLGGPEEYFDRRAVARFAELAARAADRGKAILHLAGHHHVYPVAAVKEMQQGLTFINGVAMICEDTSSLNVIEVYADGSYRIDYRKVGLTKAL
ncbi:metallophosphoesterase [Paenibacillus sp. J2TS4]|uniref:metallophosphoesterase family protein n=1 Tax=Paenibacillus sp. J2TS4 TaxID=2807194 RepID=UPI001B0093A2|nr:metallophosphoesterase [Paenibacillus sp. J2TS4]GIP30988.1 hypothetical protein J2TS4_01980 [Paenibacillus sp. J2TS4]